MSELAEKMREAKEAEGNLEQGEEKKGEENNEPQYSEYELEAMDAGWKPDKQDKDGNSLDAKEFMGRKPLFNKIHNMRDELDNVKNQLSTLSGDSKKMAQNFINEKETLVKQLKEQREEALTNLDADEVRKLDKKIEDVGTVEAQEATYSKTDWSREYIQFVKDNAWYDKNPALKSVADIIGEEFTKNNPTLSPKEIYDHVSGEIKKEFPDRFESKPNSQSKVSSSSRRTSASAGKKQVSLSDLSQEEQQIVQVMAKAVGKTTDEYLKNYEL